MAFEHKYRYIDPVLVERIGAPDAAVERAIEAEVLDAVEGVVGDLVPDVRSRPGVVDRIAPWARDLGRGLQWHAVYGTDELGATAMLKRLARRNVDPRQEERLAETVDTAWALTYHRLIDQVHGFRSSTMRSQAELRWVTPWLDAATLGYRIHLALELLHLLAIDEP